MRKLWFIAVVLIAFMLLPSGYAVSSTAEDIQPIEIATPAESLQRVYGENLAGAVYSDINLTGYTELVEEFTSNGSRYVMTYADIAHSANEHSRKWLIQQMTQLSNSRMNFSLIGNFKSIVATLPGYIPDEDDELPIFIISAHYDSGPGSPGANTDGSGIAVMLELVRIFSKYEWPLDIVFMIFNGEHALGTELGSKELSNIYAFSEVDILAMYNIDTILHQNRYVPMDQRVILAYNTGAQYWAHLAKTMGSYYGGDIVRIIESTAFGEWTASGHRHFSDKGIQNVLFAYESGYMYDDISGTQFDTPDRSEFSFYIGREVTAFIGASLAFTMSRAYGQKALLTETRNIAEGRTSTFYIPISAPTTINITCRWYGGGANFILNDPSEIMISSNFEGSAHPWEPTLVINQAVSTLGLYTLDINNFGDSTIGVDVYVEYDSDIDENGVLDSQEYWLDTALFSMDTDNDTISDAMEIILGLDVNSPDADSDEMLDTWELDVGLDPRNALDALQDPDDDNLTNLQEYTYGTNPFSSDTDQDKMTDSWEIENGLDPLVNDADEDPDNDHYTNYEEFLMGTDPNVAEVGGTPLTLWIAVPSAAVVLLGVAVYAFRRN